MAYETPKLGYAYDALEPVMTEETMRVHRDKHHTAYTTKLNTALEKHPDLLEKEATWLLEHLEQLPEGVRTPVRNFGGGHVNHAFFWTVLKKDVTAEGPVIEAIAGQWGNLDAFKVEFAEKAASLFGSGWTWLVQTPAGALEVVNTPNQDSPLTQGKTPLLALDVWEHAYYLKYKQDRAGFIEDFWSIVNWEQVNSYFRSTG